MVFKSRNFYSFLIMKTSGSLTKNHNYHLEMVNLTQQWTTKTALGDR